MSRKHEDVAINNLVAEWHFRDPKYKNLQTPIGFTPPVLCQRVHGVCSVHGRGVCVKSTGCVQCIMYYLFKLFPVLLVQLKACVHYSMIRTSFLNECYR